MAGRRAGQADSPHWASARGAQAPDVIERRAKSALLNLEVVTSPQGRPGVLLVRCRGVVHKVAVMAVVRSVRIGLVAHVSITVGVDHVED